MSLFNRPGEDELLPSVSSVSIPLTKPNHKNENQAADSSAADSAAVVLDCKKGFLDILSTHFLICNERIPGKGEDSGFECYTCEAGIIGAFDGCGGLGSKTCSNVSNKTEAYLASRAVSNAARQWFHYHSRTSYRWDATALREYIDANLKVCSRYADDTGLKLKGSMVKPFPSTMALITFRSVGGTLSSEHFWVGDSRTYVLDELGIGQISVDDIKGEDAMSNLTRDGALTNVLSSNLGFVIHQAHFEPTSPCMMMCASDGCFGYVSSPMEFEWMILSSLELSECVDEWQKKLTEEISERAGDDQTLALAAFGFSTFQEMKCYYHKRYQTVLSVVQEFEDASEEKKQLLWEQYSPGYYRHKAKEV